jgi:hypothetical protein
MYVQNVVVLYNLLISFLSSYRAPPSPNLTGPDQGKLLEEEFFSGQDVGVALTHGTQVHAHLRHAWGRRGSCACALSRPCLPTTRSPSPSSSAESMG